jgi:chaperonin GroES
MEDVAKSFKILGSRCLVKEIRESAETTSGIVIPGKEKEQTNKGIVLAVGDGALLESGEKVPVKLEVGDHVLYSSFSGSPIKVKKDDPDNYLILNERDILCVYTAQ